MKLKKSIDVIIELGGHCIEYFIALIIIFFGNRAV